MSKRVSFIRLLKKAILGEEKEFVTGSINRAIFMLSVPMILEMVMESLFAVADAFFVSRLGVNAVATVGLTESVLTLVYSLAIGLSMAATAVVARRVGEKDPAAASESAMQAIFVALAVSLLISLAGIFFARDILTLMGAAPEVVGGGFRYTQLMLGGNLTIMLLFLNNAIFRGAGDASLAMRSLWIANIINIGLDPLFIFGWGPVPAFGVAGAAIATNIGRGVGVAYQLYHLQKGKGIIQLTIRHLRIHWQTITRLLKVAAGGTGQFLISSASWIFLVRIMSLFGSEALAGYTIGVRVIIFTLLPAMGMANAAATLVGQNLGAGQPDRAEKSVWRAALYNMIFLGSISVLFLITAGDIMRIFTDEAAVIAYGTQCLQFVCLGYIFYAYGMVISQSFNGAGDTRTPTILNLFGFWVLQIPLAYLLAVTLDFGPRGVYVAIALAESSLAVASVLVFRRGAWKQVKI